MLNTWNSKKSNFDKTNEVKSVLIYGHNSNELPLISIIIPTHKRADLLKETLCSAINQDFDKYYEIVVVDNCSEVDPATDILMKETTSKHSNVLYYRNEKNIGPTGNFNRCIELSRSEWFCSLHDDDLICGNYISSIYPLVSKGIKAGAIGVLNKKIDERKRNCLSTYTDKNKLFSLLLKIFSFFRFNKPIRLTNKDSAIGINIPTCACLINKYKAIDIGGFDDIFFPVIDVVFFTKMQYYHGTALRTDFLSYYRLGYNVSLNPEVMEKLLRLNYQLRKAISSTCGLSSRYAEHFCIVYENYVKIIVSDKIDSNKIKAELGINKLYNNYFIKKAIILYHYFMWSLLFFRR